MNRQSPASQPLRKLVAKFIEQKLDAPTFCAWFEQAYNFDTEEAELTDGERDVFETLFNEVVYFSPFPDERATIANYRGEDDIFNAARAAQAKLA
jgi:hypothetical protein